MQHHKTSCYTIQSAFFCLPVRQNERLSKRMGLLRSQFKYLSKDRIHTHLHKVTSVRLIGSQRKTTNKLDSKLIFTLSFFGESFLVLRIII